MFFLDAPDRKQVIILGGESICSGSIGNQAAGQRFHGDKTDIFLFAGVCQSQIGITAEIAEWELQGVIQVGVNGFLCNGQTVVGQSDETDLALLLCFQSGIIKTGVVSWLWTERRIMKLVDVDMIRFESVRLVSRSLQKSLTFFAWVLVAM